MSVIPLATWLTSRQSQYSFSDPLWRQFVVDYQAIIAANSVVHTLLGDVINISRNNMIGYLRYIGQPTYLDQIVYLINNIPNDIALDEISTILIPNDDYIKTLWQLYQTTTAQPAQIA